MRDGHAGRRFYRGLKGARRFARLATLFLQYTHHVKRFGVPGLEFEDLPERPEGEAGIIHITLNPGHVDQGGGIFRINLGGAPVTCQRFIVARLGQKNVALVVMSLGQVGHQLQRPVGCLVSPPGLLGLVQRRRQVAPALGEIRLQFQRPLIGLNGFSRAAQFACAPRAPGRRAGWTGENVPTLSDDCPGLCRPARYWRGTRGFSAVV